MFFSFNLVSSLFLSFVHYASGCVQVMNTYSVYRSRQLVRLFLPSILTLTANGIFILSDLSIPLALLLPPTLCCWCFWYISRFLSLFLLLLFSFDQRTTPPSRRSAELYTNRVCMEDVVCVCNCGEREEG